MTFCLSDMTVLWWRTVLRHSLQAHSLQNTPEGGVGQGGWGIDEALFVGSLAAKHTGGWMGGSNAAVGRRLGGGDVLTSSPHK